jgi:tRNA (guanine-N7-)-methyltransferase
MQLRNVNTAPPDWTVAFGNDSPIEVDLGCGRGTYAWQRASNVPQVNVVALDARKKWIHQIRKAAREQALSNLRAIRCDVTQDLGLLFHPRSISGFTSHHPDPWWKKRHRKRRMIRPELIGMLATLLVPDGWVYLQTDVPDLAEEMRLGLDAHPAFSPMDAARFQQNHLGGLRSHRETKCVEKGIPVERMAYRLVASMGA